MHKDGHKIWGEILTQVKTQVSSSTFKTWFSGSRVVDFKINENRNLLIIGMKNNFLKEQVETRYLPIISKIKEQNGLTNTEVVFVVSQLLNERDEKNSPLFSGEAQQFNITKRKAEALNPTYTFDSFVVGAVNNLAFVAASQVAGGLGKNFNPLLVFGPTGVGKTHLLQAVGNQVIDKTIDAKVLYVTSEKFTNEYIQSLNNKTQQLFRQKYRNVDLLLVDDIQFLAGKEGTQDEFFHCFNELALSSKQIVIASDKHPKELGRLKERLVSRFLGGMVVDIGYPDLEMKMAIIKAKCRSKNIDLDNSLVEYIAQESVGGARELEGVLTSTMAKIKISGGKFNQEDIRQMISNNQLRNKAVVNPGKIISVVCKVFRFDEAVVKGSSRKAKVVRARQTIIYLLRSELGLSLASIGDLVGGRDHSTIIHSVEKISGLIDNDNIYRDDLLRIKNYIHNN